MSTKTLKARVQLRTQTLEEWMKIWSEFVPLLGEVCVFQVPVEDTSGNIRNEITTKVGDGVTPLEQLPWHSGLASDVYDWAKQPNPPELDHTHLFTPTGNVTIDNQIISGIVNSEFKGLESAVTGIYTPSGTISKPNVVITPVTSQFVSEVEHQSSRLTADFDANANKLVLAFAESNTSVTKEDALTSVVAELDAAPVFTGNTETITGTVIPIGTVESTFEGNSHSHTATFTGTPNSTTNTEY